jgi:hypothetical protein
VVWSPHETTFGGECGLAGFSAVLSKWASISSQAPLGQPDRLGEGVGPLPVEVPAVDLDQGDAGLASSGRTAVNVKSLPSQCMCGMTEVSRMSRDRGRPPAPPRPPRPGTSP